MTYIPFEFIYEKDDDTYMAHLETEKVGGLVTVKWQYVVDKICHTSEDHYPSLADIEKNTPSFRNHSEYGYSLGTYNEFFIFSNHCMDEIIEHVTFKIGSIAVSVGEMTPLARYIYDGYHNNDFHPEIDSISSIRILGIQPERVEAFLLYVYIKLHKEYGFKFMLFNFYDFDYPEEEKDTNGKKEYEVKAFPDHVSDIEPLRFYFKGINNDDHSNAFLQFYRVLEYYSIIQYHDNISELRWEREITTKNFILEIQKIFNKDERSAICKLVVTVADAALIARAKKAGLIESTNINVFANTLYEFRNSLVHAKYDQRGSILSESIFTPHTKLHQWRLILEDMALRTLETFGNRNT